MEIAAARTRRRPQTADLSGITGVIAKESTIFSVEINVRAVGPISFPIEPLVERRRNAPRSQ
jgi:hypothetical protein